MADINPQLRALFGDYLCYVGERLFIDGHVRDVRALQDGRIVTGIVAAEDRKGSEHRVYIQRPHGARFEGVEAECSCGMNGSCAHIVAVAIAAAQSVSKAAVGSRTPAAVRAPVTRGTLTQQNLYYLIEDAGHADGAMDCLRVSLWIGQRHQDRSSIDPASLCAFALRPTNDQEGFPRYVSEQDQVIIKSLTARASGSPWTLSGASGAAVFQQCVATGRAFWKSWTSTPLCAGGIREMSFAWKVLANGEQRLCAGAPASVRVALCFEPAMYIDGQDNACGALRIPHSIELLRSHVIRAALAPEQVADIEEQIGHSTDAATFPRPHTVTVRAQPLSSMVPKLVLSAGPKAKLLFAYNGLDIDPHSLRADHAARRMSDEPGSHVCWEITRDIAREQGFRAQLDQRIPSDSQDPASWLNFMMHGVPALQAQGWSIRVEDGFPYRMAVPEGWYSDVNTTGRESWFDLHFGVVIDGRQVSLIPALLSYLHHGTAAGDGECLRIGEHVVIRLANRTWLTMPLQRIERIAHTLVELHQHRSSNGSDGLSLPISQATRIAQLAVELDSPRLRCDDDALRALIDELATFSGIRPVAAPAHFPTALRPYQQEGLSWLQFLRRHRLGGILADDMGLGKTVQTLAHLVLEKSSGRLHAPSLIVAPVSVISNWFQELRRFAPELSVVTLHGSQRRTQFATARHADIVLTGYSLLQLDSEFLLGLEFHFLILDEAQVIKNPRAKVAEIARALRARYRLCLTGTPLENHLGELWSLFEFLQPGLLGSERDFQRDYRIPIEKNADTARAQALRRRIAPFVLRRTKQDVASELPSKTQIVESLALEEAQRDFYDGIRLAMHRRVQEAIAQQGIARSHITLLDALLKLRQACCDPRLVRDDAETRTLPSAKLDWLRTVLPELVAESRRILLFSQFTSMLGLIETVLEELSIPYCLLTGATRERMELVRRFQSGSVPVFLISLKAGGVGLNLTAADTVIHYDPWWNPAIEAQATDRAHRIGQDQPVFVYKLIAQGTIEEKITRLQAHKQALAEQIYMQHATAPSQWTMADIEALFSP